MGVRPLPNPAQRTCTANLKVKTVHRYLRRNLGWPTRYPAALGYRADEEKRVEKALRAARSKVLEGGQAYVPMYLAGADTNEVNRFFATGPFDLQMDSDFGNCDLCFMVSTWKLKARMMHFALEEQIKVRPGAPMPTRVARWVDWEERESDRPGVFRKDRPTYRQLWEQVCIGNMESTTATPEEDRCGVCAD